MSPKSNFSKWVLWPSYGPSVWVLSLGTALHFWGPSLGHCSTFRGLSLKHAIAFLGSQPGALQHPSGTELRVHCSIFRGLKLGCHSFLGGLSQVHCSILEASVQDAQQCLSMVQSEAQRSILGGAKPRVQHSIWRGEIPRHAIALWGG